MDDVSLFPWQYLSLLDETPAYMGGRDNGWRKLTLEGNSPLPSHPSIHLNSHLFVDILSFFPVPCLSLGSSPICSL